MTNTIYLNNGTFFNFLEPEKSMYGIYDIANALSKICRFTGQGNEFYSVAEHSVFVSLLVEDSLAMEALLHDASEAFIGDVSTPLKRLLPEYKVIEERIEQDVCRRFDLPYPLTPAVKYADKQAFYVEKEQVMGNLNSLEYLNGVEKPDIKIKFLNHTEAKTAFINRYFELKRKMENE